MDRQTIKEANSIINNVKIVEDYKEGVIRVAKNYGLQNTEFKQRIREEMIEAVSLAADQVAEVQLLRLELALARL